LLFIRLTTDGRALVLAATVFTGLHLAHDPQGWTLKNRAASAAVLPPFAPNNMSTIDQLWI
jgi:hypothetical protein